LIRKRLSTLDAAGWKLIAERESEITNQLLLVGAIKHSQLLGDFMRNVYASCQRRLEPSFAPSDWGDFLIECAHQDPAVTNWSNTTKAKLFQVTVRILAETKYLVSAKTMQLSPRALHPVVRRYLHDRNESYALDCLERLK
jgi:hypothetical protein